MKKTIQITAGQEPNESSHVVAKVLKIFLKELATEAIEYTILSKTSGYENGTIQTVTLVLEGLSLEPFLKNWIGTIVWVGSNVFRKNNRKKKWYIAIFELTDNALMEVDESCFSFDYMRSVGPGGQHVNKVNTAVRANYTPFLISIVVMETRSQHRNKKIAIARLKEKCLQYQIIKLYNDVKDKWNEHLIIKKENPIRTFYGSDFKRENKVKSFKKERNTLKRELRKLI